MIILLFGRDEVFAIMGGGGGGVLTHPASSRSMELESLSHICVWEQVMNSELAVRLMKYLHG